jgi:hypothetical protein
LTDLPALGIANPGSSFANQVVKCGADDRSAKSLELLVAAYHKGYLRRTEYILLIPHVPSVHEFKGLGQGGTVLQTFSNCDRYPSPVPDRRPFRRLNRGAAAPTAFGRRVRQLPYMRRYYRTDSVLLLVFCRGVPSPVVGNV